MDLVQRARDIVLSPANEWSRIERESGDPGYLFVNYVAWLAAIPPVCLFLRWHVFGWRWARFHHHGGIIGGLFGAVIHWLAAFVVVYAISWIVDALARTFSAEPNRENALKLVVYAMTPAWLAGVFALVPGLGFLRFLAILYAIYLFWLGLPALMKPPPDQVGRYAMASVLCAVVVFAVAGAVVGPIL